MMVCTVLVLLHLLRLFSAVSLLVPSLEWYHLSTNKLHSPKLSMKACKLEQYEGGILFINKHATILARCHVSTPLWFPTADDGNQTKSIENKQLTLLLEDFPAEMLVSN